ncbi:MAG TPA: archaemetzincin [Thermoanaerobaculia bacterium]
MEAVRPLYQPKSRLVFAGDWLYDHPEPGQTFEQYLASRPNLAREGRRVISVRPLGDLTPARLRIVELAADYLERFFGLPARVEPPLPLDDVPASASRIHPEWKTRQIRTGYLLGVLQRWLPIDAAAHIGLTSYDLYPNEKYNFVFGQASLRTRVGVWSLHHFGEPDKDDQEFRVVLLRALKTASHETAHMFSLHHCTKYECVMNGSNSLYESDSRPLDTCPECMAKICWATRCDPARRYERLAAFCLRHGLARERLAFEKAHQILMKKSLVEKGR